MDSFWTGIILLLSWASLPITMIYAVSVFDKDVVKPGEDPHHH